MLNDLDIVLMDADELWSAMHAPDFPHADVWPSAVRISLLRMDLCVLWRKAGKYEYDGVIPTANPNGNMLWAIHDCRQNIKHSQCWTCARRQHA
jgi:hypothetical protein